MVNPTIYTVGGTVQAGGGVYIPRQADRDLENLSPNLSPKRREALNSPHSLLGKGAGGLGFAFVFPHNVKSGGNNHV